MIGFITLTLRTERTSIAVNPEHISTIKDLRTDKGVKDDPGWQYTVVNMSNGCTYKVKETVEEIYNLIGELL